MVPYKPLLNASGEASVHSPGEKRLRHHRLELHELCASGPLELDYSLEHRISPSDQREGESYKTCTRCKVPSSPIIGRKDWLHVGSERAPKSLETFVAKSQRRRA